MCISYLFVSVYIFFFKQKTAYEMRISDWSSDVCSSDLDHRSDERCGERAGRFATLRQGMSVHDGRLGGGGAGNAEKDGGERVGRVVHGDNADPQRESAIRIHQIGRASWRERGGQYV